MASDGELRKILRALKDTSKEDIVKEERERRQAARQSRVDANLEDVPFHGEDARVRIFLLLVEYSVFFSGHLQCSIVFFCSLSTLSMFSTLTTSPSRKEVT